MAAFKQLPPSPTNADLAFGLEQLHECLEEHITKTTPALKRLRAGQLSQATSMTKLRTSQNKTSESVSLILAEQAKVKDALGVETARKPVALLSQTRFMLTMFGIVGAVGGTWRFIEFSTPFVWAYVKALHLYIIR
jgi:hypothetical protein